MICSQVARGGGVCLEPRALHSPNKPTCTCFLLPAGAGEEAVGKGVEPAIKEFLHTVFTLKAPQKGSRPGRGSVCPCWTSHVLPKSCGFPPTAVGRLHTKPRGSGFISGPAGATRVRTEGLTSPAPARAHRFSGSVIRRGFPKQTAATCAVQIVRG